MIKTLTLLLFQGTADSYSNLQLELFILENIHQLNYFRHLPRTIVDSRRSVLDCIHVNFIDC